MEMEMMKSTAELLDAMRFDLHNVEVLILMN